MARPIARALNLESIMAEMLIELRAIREILEDDCECDCEECVCDLEVTDEDEALMLERFGCRCQ